MFEEFLIYIPQGWGIYQFIGLLLSSKCSSQNKGDAGGCGAGAAPETGLRRIGYGEVPDDRLLREVLVVVETLKFEKDGMARYLLHIG